MITNELLKEIHGWFTQDFEADDEDGDTMSWWLKAEDVAGIEAALRELIELRALVLASRPALVTGADAVYACGLRIAQLFGQQHVSAQQALEHSLQLRTLSAYGVGT